MEVRLVWANMAELSLSKHGQGSCQVKPALRSDSARRHSSSKQRQKRAKIRTAANSPIISRNPEIDELSSVDSGARSVPNRAPPFSRQLSNRIREYSSIFFFFFNFFVKNKTFLFPFSGSLLFSLSLSLSLLWCYLSRLTLTESKDQFLHWREGSSPTFTSFPSKQFSF